MEPIKRPTVLQNKYMDYVCWQMGGKRDSIRARLGPGHLPLGQPVKFSVQNKSANETLAVTRSAEFGKSMKQLIKWCRSKSKTESFKGCTRLKKPNTSLIKILHRNWAYRLAEKQPCIFLFASNPNSHGITYTYKSPSSVHMANRSTTVFFHSLISLMYRLSYPVYTRLASVTNNV